MSGRTKGPQQSELEQLRQATREAREALADLKAERQAMEQIMDQAVAEVKAELQRRVQAMVEHGLAELGQAIEYAKGTVFERFDRIADMLLNETRADQRAGKPSLEELAGKVVEVKRGQG